MHTVPEARPDRLGPVRVERSPRTPGVSLIRLPQLDDVAPINAAEAFRDLPGLVLLESARPGRTGRWTYLSADPLATLEAPAEGTDPLAEARRLLGRMDATPPLPADAEMVPGDARETSAAPPFCGGLVGYLGYDLARRLERLPSIADADQAVPPLRLALHDWVLAWDRRSGAAWLAGRAVDGDAAGLGRRLAEVLERVGATPRADVRPTSPDPMDHPERFVSRTSHAAWVSMVEAVRAAIARGEIYQANVSRRLETPFNADPWPVFRRLRTGDPALFSGYLDLGPSPTGARRALLSASPEPFLAVGTGGLVATDPIKGTRPRGRTRQEDREFARELLASGKDRAENVMIVDVLRNDLGRVCVPGSVRVPRLLRLERTATVQHLVTTVTGRLRAGLGPLDLLAAAFPGGSITGAPKIRAMEIIERLEPVRRGPYCGVLAWIGPDLRMGSSILIRTFVADGSRLTLHVGGGITWRSDPDAEWDETVAKAHGPLSSIGAVEVAE